jgi:multidrug efflux pump subunit AcrA (membrane-fusion protein)
LICIRTLVEVPMSKRSPAAGKTAKRTTPAARALLDARQQVKAVKQQVKLLKSQLKLARAALKAARSAKKEAAQAARRTPAPARAGSKHPAKKPPAAPVRKARPAAMSAMPVAPLVVDTPPLVEPADL